MTPERWRQVETLFHSALELPVERRPRFLAEATTGDQELAREVESLLAALSRPGELNEDAAPALAAEMLESSRQRLPEGAMLAHYRVLDLVGAGGMGEVYRALDTRLQRTVALKVLIGDASRGKERARRLVAEARAASALNHPNIAIVYEMGEADGSQYIAMEFVDGETLAHRLRRGAMPGDEIRRIGRQIAEALGEAHARGVVHRDIKPGNIILTPRGAAKVLDFGVAKIFSGDTNLTAAGTLPGMVVGTLRYISPEQLRGEPVDGRADLYSLGAVLYEMATGRPPFESESPTGVMTKILHDPPVPPSQLRKSVPPEIEHVILRCLEKDRDLRYRTASDVIAALEGQDIPPARPRLSRRIWLTGALVVALFAAVAAWLSLVRPWMSAGEIRSLAVLPLQNLTGSSAEQYLPDGITESLITDLASLRPLRVISRTSVMRYKNSNRPLKDVARELNVDGLVQGSVARSGNRIRVSVQLVKASNETQLWAQSYERDVKDLLDLERDLSRTIAREIAVRVGPEDPKKLPAPEPVDPAAYESYLRGRYQMSMLTPDTLQDAVRLFEQSAADAPGFAQAYTGLSDAYNLMTPYANLAPDAVYPKAKAAAVKALALDDNLAEAHASLAVVEHEYDWNHASAETHFRRALELSPSYGNAHEWYGEFLVRLRRFDEGIAEIRRAQALDPLSLPINAALGWALSASGKAADAAVQLQKTIDLDPKFAPAHGYLGWNLLRTRHYSEAVREYESALSLSGRNPRYIAGVAVAYALAGQTARAQSAQTELDKASQQSFVPAYHWALIAMALTGRSAALAELDKASTERGVSTLNANTEPLFDPLQTTPEFQRLRRRCGF